MIKCVAHKTVQDWGKDNESESRIPKFSFVHDPQRVAEWQLAQVYNGERPWRAVGDGKASVDDAFILQHNIVFLTHASLEDQVCVVA